MYLCLFHLSIVRSIDWLIYWKVNIDVSDLKFTRPIPATPLFLSVDGVSASTLIDRSCHQWMRKLTHISPFNTCPSKSISASRLICSEIIHTINILLYWSECVHCQINCTNATKLWYICVWRELDISVRFIIVVSDGHVLHGSQENNGLLKNASQKASQISFFSTKIIEKIPTADFSISVCSTPNQNHPTTLITAMIQVMEKTPLAAVVW